MPPKNLNVAKAKGVTSTGMSFEVSGNVAGVCQELFNYIGNGAARQIVVEAIIKQHVAMTEREAVERSKLKEQL